MNSPVTMRQIAERAGVSIGTVSHVVNGTAKVREKLRQRVLEAIRSLGYHPANWPAVFAKTRPACWS